MNTEEIEALRHRYWNIHPIIKANAILPTRAMKDALARVMTIAIRARASIAFYAFPEFGKSSCLRALEAEISAKFPKAGVLNLEFGDDDLAPSEGRMLETMMFAAGYGDGMAKSIAGKREQIHRGLLAYSGEDRHIFLFIDEAQEMMNQHFRWLKRVINHLAKDGVDVTTVLFGQRELLDTKADLAANGRSDLSIRFMKKIIPYRGVSTNEDIKVIMRSIDSCRWVIEDHELIYTEFLFPKAFRAGFRFEHLSDKVSASLSSLPKTQLRNGLPMAVIGSFLSLLCGILKDKDSAEFEFGAEAVEQAFISAYRGA